MQALAGEGREWSRGMGTHREQGPGSRRVPIFMTIGWHCMTYDICLVFSYGIHISTLGYHSYKSFRPIGICLVHENLFVKSISLLYQQ